MTCKLAECRCSSKPRKMQWNNIIGLRQLVVDNYSAFYVIEVKAGVYLQKNLNMYS